MILEALGVFALMFILDFAWSGYIKAVADSHPLRAAAIASVLMVVNGGVVLSYVKNPYMLIPVALGAFAGTYTEIWWRLRRQRRVLKQFNTSGTSSRV